MGPTLELSVSGVWWASLSIVQLPTLACGEREAMVKAQSPMCDSAVSPCFHGCLAFLHRHFPPQSPPSHPLDSSLCSQQQPSPWDCATIPKLQLPASVPSRGPESLSGVCMAVTRTVWFSFHLGCHRPAVSLSALNVSPLTQTVAPMWGIGPLLQFPHLPRAGPVLLTLQFPPQLLPPTESSMVLYILSHWSGTPVCSQLVVCVHFCVWRCVPDVSSGERCAPPPPTPLTSCSPL